MVKLSSERIFFRSVELPSQPWQKTRLLEDGNHCLPNPLKAELPYVEVASARFNLKAVFSNPNFRSITTNLSTSRTTRASTLPICFHQADQRKQDPEITSLSQSPTTKEPPPAGPLPSATMPGLVTATGVLAFLADEEPELKVFALKTLNEDIDTVWFEVADALTQMYVSPRLRQLTGGGC